PREAARMNQPQQPGFGRGGGFQQPQPQAATATKIRMHYIAADERKNVVHVSGPADVVAKAKRFLTEIDTKGKGQEPIAIGEPFLKVYTVSGNAEAIAKTLTNAMKTSGSLNVTAIGTTSIAVWGGPQDHIDVLKQIEGTKTKIENKLFALSVLDAAK